MHEKSGSNVQADDVLYLLHGMLPSAFPFRETPFILCKMENVFWSAPRVGTEKFALKFMVNLDKCHHSAAGRKSPKSKPKHIAK